MSQILLDMLCLQTCWLFIGLRMNLAQEFAQLLLLFEADLDL